MIRINKHDSFHIGVINNSLTAGCLINNSIKELACVVTESRLSQFNKRNINSGALLCNGTKINEYLSSLQKSKITQAQGHNKQLAIFGPLCTHPTTVAIVFNEDIMINPKRCKKTMNQSNCNKNIIFK